MKDNSANGQMANGKPVKVAIVCDWLTGIGGAELVLLEIHKQFPDAPIYTSQYDPKSIDWFKDADVRTGWLQKFPASLKKLLPVLRAWYFSRLNLSDYDLIITSNTGAEAKGIKTNPNQIHICYMHAPTHYYWSRYDEYMQNPGWGGFNWLGRIGLRLLIAPMRKWDLNAAQRPDFIIANSYHTQNSIRKYYGRASTVVHPPVDTDFFGQQTNTGVRDGFVITGRQTPYKRFDLAVEACSRLGLKLTVIGDGPDHQKLKSSAGPTVTFLGKIPRSQVRDVLQSSEAFIFPGIDDFGIAPVEALAAGTPVIAYKAGGALDYVTSKTGLFFNTQSVESLSQALKQFNPDNYQSDDIKSVAQAFGLKNFHKKLRAELERVLQ